MAITSAEIHEQGFSVTRKAGYDIDEVDVFLEYVASGIDALNAEIEELLAQIDELQAQASLAPAADYEPAAAPAPLTPAHGDFEASESEKDARIAELEAALAEKELDASAISNALVTAQRSAQLVVDDARADAKRIIAEAEEDAASIIARAEAEKEKIEDTIDALDASHKQTCEDYSAALRAFIEDASKKLDDVEDELARKEGRKQAHARFSNPAQAPVMKPSVAPAGTNGAVAPSYVAPTAASVMPVSHAKPSAVEKDLSGFGDASDAIDLGDLN